jgi:XTP/dITP diphosphohydrolase
VIPALGGQPGIHSARWAGPGKDFAHGIARIEAAMAGITDMRAHFVCALSLAWPDGHAETFEGFVYGRLVFPPRGTLGFGYDPIFVADGETLTFAEMQPAAKHAISHRADAFRQLVAACLQA